MKPRLIGAVFGVLLLAVSGGAYAWVRHQHTQKILALGAVEDECPLDQTELRAQQTVEKLELSLVIGCGRVATIACEADGHCYRLTGPQGARHE